MKKVASVFAMLALSLALAGSPMRPALAGGHHHHHHHGNGAAAIGLGVMTGIIALGAISEAEAARRAHEHGCEVGPKECRWVRKRCFYDPELDEDVCRGGYRKCWRREYCD
jgi:hypothetical protein